MRLTCGQTVVEDEQTIHDLEARVEARGLLRFFPRARVSKGVFLLVLSSPIILLGALVIALPTSWRHALFGEFLTTTTTTTPNPAVFADEYIQRPGFAGLMKVFGGTALISAAGGLTGLFAWVFGQLLGLLGTQLRAGCCAQGGTQGAESATLKNDEEGCLVEAMSHQPLLETSGERGLDLPFPELAVHEQFLQVANANPDLVCVRGIGSTISYSEFLAGVQAAATVLSQVGVRGGELAALYLSEALPAIISILGVWITGGAWLPMDREAPRIRLVALIADGQPVAIICDDTIPFLEVDVALLRPDVSGLRFVLEREGSMRDAATCSDLKSGCVAQVIYTSGSTGLPKGVIYSHRRISFACHFFSQHCKITNGTAVLQKTPYIWAVFRHEVFPALSHGGTLVLARPWERKDPRQLAELARHADVEVLVATPSVLELVLEAAGAPLPRLRHAICMGEGLHAEAAARIFEHAGPNLELHNFYGATETENTFFTVPQPSDALWASLTRRYMPAGHPQPCVSVHILDPDTLDARPAGVSGEICFGGVLSDGYWRKPELTAQRFIDHPLLGRIYRTGDVGLWDRCLGLQVVGRTDRQVKIRGIRVELEEVEAGLRESVKVIGGQEAAVVAAPSPGFGSGTGNDDLFTIVAFVAPARVDIAAVRQGCRERLPPYMVPGIIQGVDSLPRLPNQKVDLRALASMAEKAEETVQALDSLGMLRMLSRAQVQEDVWVQNQQAFWMLVVMLGHFQLNSGAAWSEGKDSGNLAWRIEMCLGHGKDMVAFILMVGFTDSRDPISFGPRDVVLVVLALMMSGPLVYILSPGFGPLSQVFSPPTGIPDVQHGWFLYSFVAARLSLCALHKRGVPPRWQVGMTFVLSALFPDDIWGVIPEDWRLTVWQRHAGLRYKGFRWSFIFVPACYLLGFHAGMPVVSWARRRAPSARWKVATLVGACWTGYLAMSVLNAPNAIVNGGYGTFQAVYDESRTSHLVTFDYMTHPAMHVYVGLFVCEWLLFVIPPLFVAVAMAYCPVHFRTLGTTSLGNYVLHPTYIGAPWLHWVQEPVLTRITSPEYNIVSNVAITFVWNVAFCAFFALTASAAFHRGLVRLFGLLKHLSDWRASMIKIGDR